MSESPDNWGYVCGHCRPKPNPAYLEVPSASFVGKFCKLAFPFEGDRREFMWVKVLGLAESAGEELRGRLDNDPVNAPFQCGDLFDFKRSEILDVCD